jgi:hypothetical protein
MVHDPRTLTLQAALQAYFEQCSQGVWVEMFRLAHVRAKSDNMTITEAIEAELSLRLKAD